MRHDPKFIASVAKLMPLLHTHRPLRGMGFGQLCDYLSYFWNHGTMSYVLNYNDSPNGVCLIKFFRELHNFVDAEFIHEPDGEFCMVILLVADTPNAIGQMFDELVGRWGPGRTMLWDRGQRTESGAPRMYTWEEYLKLTRRLTYGFFENA
jgi:hypothetical protein